MAIELESGIASRLELVKQRIAEAAERANRDPESITLVAVTKTWPVEFVVAAYHCGVRNVGENRPEELADKKLDFLRLMPGISDLAWHQIGTVQSRKSKYVVDHAGYFHALDRLKIARRLSSQLQSEDRSLPVLIEVNLSGEESKSGFLANKWEEDATQQNNLRNEIETIARLPGLKLRGLMTMAPWGVPESEIRSVFRRTRMLAEWLREELPAVEMSQLSMGMSDDFEIAVEEGATMVRVGRSIFGDRH